MSVQSTVAAGTYTEAILNDNFTQIAKGFQSVNNHIQHLEGHISELYEMAQGAAKVAAKTKAPGRIKPFIFGAAVGVALYSYSKKNQHKIEAIKREAQERIDQVVNPDSGTRQG